MKVTGERNRLSIETAGEGNHCYHPACKTKIESIERRHTVYQMYLESNVTSCICHGLGINTVTKQSESE